MSKTLIIDAIEDDSVPFLRGILTRSLRRAGMSFDDAYALATTIRRELEGVEETTTVELHERVLAELSKIGSQSIINRYQTRATKNPVILVEGLDGQLSPYSDEHFSRELVVLGLDNHRIRIAVKKMHEHLLKSGYKKIHVNHLGHMVYRCMHQDELFGPEIADRYLTWVNFTRSGHPLILLIGGTSGSGKSTVATALASRLDIVRTQSTDMLREVMRMMIPERLLPALHQSSFDAWKALPSGQIDATEDPAARLIAGYQTQAELLSVPCEAVIHRALQENISLVLEGVHVTPPLLDNVPEEKLVVVVNIMLAVLKKKDLKKRLQGRSKIAPDRRADDFSASFSDIWRLQSFLLGEADQADVSIVVNEDKEEAMREIMIIVVNQLAADYAATAKQVFGDDHPNYALYEKL